jgi:hypothetical protein
MNQMAIKGVNSQTFVAANLGRVEKFYRDLLELPVVNGGYHLRLSKFYWRAAAWSHDWTPGFGRHAVA